MYRKKIQFCKKQNKNGNDRPSTSNDNNNYLEGITNNIEVADKRPDEELDEPAEDIQDNNL